ncbi:MAG TPA: hypothetical protein DCP28_09150, partial [Cytophagales bacterium]|nr:hypothetical protein [Cytophagales bacterium]
MNRPSPKVLEVIKSERLTPNMHRITLQGPLTPDPNWRAGSYVKLILPDPETGALSFDKADKPKVRTYTARKFDLKEQTVTIDFAIHQPAGP